MSENKQTTKTLDDILSEMRNAAKDSYAEKTAKRLEDHEAAGTRDALDINDAIQCLRDDDKYLLDLANRIETAVTRMQDAYCDLCKEKDAAYDRLLLERDKAIKVNNSNAAAMRDLLEKIRNEYCNGLISCRTCVSSEADVERISDIFQKQIDAALSAPPRNCDRFETYFKAKRAWENVCKAGLPEQGPFDEWLFAHATEMANFG